MFQGSFKKHLKLAFPAYIILVLILIIASASNQDFRTSTNFSNIVAQSSVLAIVAIGQTLILLIGGIDLSNGAVLSISTVVMAQISYASTGSMWFAIVLALIIGCGVGAMNGFGIMKLNIPPMIMTLASGSIVTGIALFIQSSPGGKINLELMKFVTKKFPPFNTLGVITIILYIIFTFILVATKWGRNLYAVGGNAISAKKSGISVFKTYMSTYMVAGTLAAFGGILLSARLFSGDPVIGENYAMDTITAVILGGTMLTGGEGGIIGTLAGVFIVAMIGNVLNMLEIFPYYQYIIKGLILVTALLVKVVDKEKLKSLVLPKSRHEVEEA